MLLYVTPSELQSDTAAMVASWSLWTSVGRRGCRETWMRQLHPAQKQGRLVIPCEKFNHTALE